MDALVEQLDAKLREWNQTTADEVRQRVAEIIELADHDALDVARSQTPEEQTPLTPSELTESVGRIRLALEQMERGEGMPFEEFDQDFRRKFQIPSDA